MEVADIVWSVIFTVFTIATVVVMAIPFVGIVREGLLKRASSPITKEELTALIAERDSLVEKMNQMARDNIEGMESLQLKLAQSDELVNQWKKLFLDAKKKHNEMASYVRSIRDDLFDLDTAPIGEPAPEDSNEDALVVVKLDENATKIDTPF